MEFCGDYHFLEGVRLAIYILNIFKIIIPLLLIGFGTYDFIKTVLDPNKNEMKDSAKQFATRIASAVIIFLLPNIIATIFGLFSNFSNTLIVFNDCIKNANKGYIEVLKKNALANLKDYESQDYISKYDADKYNRNTSSSSSSSSSNVNSGEILEVAKTDWQKVSAEFTTYGGSWNIPPTGKTIDCSAFVSWVLYDAGYTDEFNHQHTTGDFYNTNWNEKYGWEEIPVSAGEDVTSKLKPGDILVRDTGGGVGAAGHVNITVSVDNGTVMAYDCGSANNWLKSEGNPVDKTRFAKSDKRAGKIIRVTKNNNNNNNNSNNQTSSN